MKTPWVNRAATLAVMATALVPNAGFANPLVGTTSGAGNIAVSGTGTTAATGVQGKSDTSVGVVGSSNTSFGVYGSSTSSTGVYGASTSSKTTDAGVLGIGNQCPGVAGQSITRAGVTGLSGSGNGVSGTSSNGDGVSGVSTDGTGVVGVSTNGNGVYGTTSSTDAFAGGVHGNTTDAGNAVFAESQGPGTGLRATSSFGNAIYATSNTTDAIVGVAGTNAGSTGMWGKANGAGTYGVYSSGDLYVRSGGGTTGRVWKPGGGMWENNSSDARVKKDVVDFTPSLTELEKVRPVRYKYNGLGGTDDSGTEYIGVIAQELEKALPFMVTSHKRKLHESDAQPTDIKGVDPNAFTYLLINAVKELSQQNKELARQVGALNEQSKRIAKIAALVCQEHPASKLCDNAHATADLALAHERQ